MKIGMILPGKFPPDIRVEKEIRSLIPEHEIFLLCLRRGNQNTTEELHGVAIRRVFSGWQRRWSSWRLLSACRSGHWTRAIWKFIEDNQPDVLHVHDLPLLGSALEATKDNRLPIVADLHENYPAMLATQREMPFWRTRSLGSWTSRLFSSIERWKEYERDAVTKADRVIAVIEEARDRLVRIGVDPSRIYVVGNYASLDEPSTLPARDNRVFRVLYAGSFGPTRDLATVVASVARLPREEYPRLRIELVGGSGSDLGRLQRMALDLGVEDRVSVIPWLPLAEAEGKMDNADVGLVPHVKSEHTDTTIPHKLFQYMWKKLPVIVSDCAPLQRIVDDSACGLTYPHGDAVKLAHCLGQLYKDRQLVKRMGDAGHTAVRDQYNWDRAGTELLKVFDQLR